MVFSKDRVFDGHAGTVRHSLVRVDTISSTFSAFAAVVYMKEVVIWGDEN